MNSIDRKLLFHLVDIVWGVAHEDESVPSTEWAREMIQKAIERRRGEKYSHLSSEPIRDECDECGGKRELTEDGLVCTICG